MSTAPSPAAPAHPVLHNLGALLLKYGPILLQWLISSGILKLPGGVTLPPLPGVTSQLDPATKQVLDTTDCEVDLGKLAEHLKVASELLHVSVSA